MSPELELQAESNFALQVLGGEERGGWSLACSLPTSHGGFPSHFIYLPSSIFAKLSEVLSLLSVRKCKKVLGGGGKEEARAVATRFKISAFRQFASAQ